MFGFRPLFRVFTLYEAYGRTKLPNSDLQHLNIICLAVALLSDFLRIFVTGKSIAPHAVMKKEWNDVREFHEKFGHPVAGVPKMVDKKRALSRGKWMNEEVAEFLVAEDIYEQADAMIDLIYFALGTLVEMGLEADELFDIVQQANMSKLWPDGKPHYNPKDGKVIKPADWQDPAPKIRAYIDSVIASKNGAHGGR